MFFLLSVPAATLPVLVAVFVIWWLDRYDREPIWMMLIALGWGATFAIGLGIMGTLLLQAIFVDGSFSEAESTVAQAVYFAPFVEEITKIMIFGLLFWLKDFDNATDGFVYGATAGLGFAMTENFLYFNNPELVTSGEAWFSLVLMRNFFTGPMHAVATATLGACIGHVKYTRSWLLFLFLPMAGFGLALGIHVSWNNFMISYAQGGGEYLFPLAILCLACEGLIAFAVFMASIHFEGRALRTELAEEAQLGIIPQDHVLNLASYFKRRGGNWAQGVADVAAYVKAATTLAFRKQQWRSSGEDTQQSLDKDIQELRATLRKLNGGKGRAAPASQGYYPQQGYPPQGYPQQGYPPQGYPPQGFQNPYGDQHWQRWNPH